MMDELTIRRFEQSLMRCVAVPEFLDRFYEIFLASSPKVKEKFAHTDFEHQTRMVRESLFAILRAAEDQDGGPEAHLDHIAHRHSRADLGIGAELYDLWLDSLLEAVQECDSEFEPETEQAWEELLSVGIQYMCSRYNSG